MTRLKWKLSPLEIVLILTQDSYTVCVERAIGSEIVCTHPMQLLGGVVMWNLTSFHLETVLVSLQDRCMVCAIRTTGSEIVLDALDGTTG